MKNHLSKKTTPIMYRILKKIIGVGKGRWDSKKFVRSNSRPGYFRTGSKTYVRDNTRFSKQGSGIRYASKS